VRDDNTEGDGTTGDLDGRHPAAPAATPTPVKYSVPWLRVAIEGVVIVSSIWAGVRYRRVVGLPTYSEMIATGALSLLTSRPPVRPWTCRPCTILRRW
jgi:hypothetical protein